jgi:hypothetical protein
MRSGLSASVADAFGAVKPVRARSDDLSGSRRRHLASREIRAEIAHHLETDRGSGHLPSALSERPAETVRATACTRSVPAPGALNDRTSALQP